ncbi:GSCOCG00009214001-RA-CDS [Cotesia congregata]|nr:GSCOCG00009214001-RA-CDS [Cotesia congregata]
MSLILSLLVRHNVTQTCLGDIITVINLHCLQNNNNGFKNSLHKFRKFFSLSKKGTVKKTKHFYCVSCQKNLENENDICGNCELSKKAYFIEVPVRQQLIELYRRPGFYECLQHRFNARLEDNNHYTTDIYNGSLYQSFVANGFLANQDNISLTWYTDGIPVYKSSKVSMWPVYLSINELPFVERTKRQNLLMIGLWFGPQKPNANNYFYKFYKQFKTLSRGINVTVSTNDIKNIKAVLLFGTCDLPAKCQFFNFTYYMGSYGCPSCLWPGETYRLGEDGNSHTHVYRYTPDPEMRTSRECVAFAETALNENSPHMGVKGPCALSKLMPDFVVGTAIDQMHCVFGGVVKKLLSLWFDSSHRGEPYSLVDTANIINDRLMSIKPPSFVHRMPRSTEDLVHWKASELKNWFFYYALPVLEGIMQREYFENFSLFVAGISLLNSDSITNNDVIIACNFLHKFVREFEILYGLKHCSINVHLLIHLPKCVQALGPLYATECFQYEDLNGQYLNVINGTRHIDSQVVRSHNQQLKLQRFFDELPEGKIKEFCMKHKHNSKIGERIQESCYSIGCYKVFNDNYIIPNNVQHALENLLPAQKIYEYLRLLKDSKLYVSERYTRSKQTSSSYILYRDQTGYHLGSVLCFVKLSYCECLNLHNCPNHRPSVHQAIVENIVGERVFLVRGDHNVQYELPYMFKCTKMNNFVSISIDQLISVCFEIKIGNDLHIAIPVNSNSNE